MMAKRILAALLGMSLASPAFANDLEKSIAAQAALLAQAPAAQTSSAQAPEQQQIPAPPVSTPGGSNKTSKVLMFSGLGLVAFGATLITYGSASSCAGSTTSTKVYSNSNECYSDKVTGWMLGVGAGSALLIGSLFTRNK
jgi:hypothetical protein